MQNVTLLKFFTLIELKHVFVKSKRKKRSNLNNNNNCTPLSRCTRHIYKF